MSEQDPKYFKSISGWREWLIENGPVGNPIWVVIQKKASDKDGIGYEEAVMEAIAFGWIDGKMKSLNDDEFMQRFSKRRKNSVWSLKNRKRAERLMSQGRMTPAGLEAVNQAKRNGSWESAVSSKSPAVQNLLGHLYRYSQSYSSRQSYLRHLLQYSKWTRRDPDQLAGLGKREAESLVQRFVDHIGRKNRTRTYLNTVIKRLKTFYRTNGYRNQKELEIHHYHVPTRYRKTPEYIPGKPEIYSMANAAGGPRNRALILGLWTSGTRVNTFLALNYGDISKEIKNQETHIKIPIYPEMKDRVKNACKGSITYHTFISAQATNALKTYLRQRTEKHGEIQPEQPLFHSQWTMWSKKQKPYKRLYAKQVRKIIKKSARQAGIQKWKHITPTASEKPSKPYSSTPPKTGIDWIKPPKNSSWATYYPAPKTPTTTKPEPNNTENNTPN